MIRKYTSPKSYIIVTVTGYIYYLSSGKSHKEQIDDFRIGEDWIMMEEEIDPETELPRSRKVAECYNGNIVQLVPISAGKGVRNETMWIVDYTNGDKEEMTTAEFRSRFDIQPVSKQYKMSINRGDIETITEDCEMRSKYCVKSVSKIVSKKEISDTVTITVEEKSVLTPEVPKKRTRKLSSEETKAKQSEALKKYWERKHKNKET